MSDISTKLPVVNKKEVVHKGKWLSTNLLHYTDSKGAMRQWESVGRTTKIQSDVGDAVAIIPVLKRILHHDCFVMVKQFRPPVGCYTLEFPAGLIDAEDNGPTGTAIRELYEETGYKGQIQGVVEDCFSTLDPGILESTMAFVCIEIDGDSKENENHQQHLDDGEFVDIVLYPVHDFTVPKLRQWCKKSEQKILLDSRVHSYALGYQMAKAMCSKKCMISLMDDAPNA